MAKIFGAYGLEFVFTRFANIDVNKFYNEKYLTAVFGELYSHKYFVEIVGMQVYG